MLSTEQTNQGNLHSMNDLHILDAFGVIRGRFILPRMLILVSLCLIFNAKAVNAEPYIPESDTQILEYLPKKLISSDLKIDDLVKQFELKPTDEIKREELINAYLQKAKSTGDMRYVSYAQNRLEYWLQETPKSEKARFLNARLMQYEHKFKESIEELNSLLIEYPENTKAWSLLANLYLITGNYDAAKASCKQLSIRTNLTDALICQSNIMIRTGELRKSFKVLNTILPTANKMSAKRRLWLYTSLAEIMIQQGNNEKAGQYLEQAMSLVKDNDFHDAYLSRLNVDYLIQNHKYKKAFSLIYDENNDTALMIRSAMLAKKLDDYVIFDSNKATLSQIFNVEKRRGQSQHLREQALFNLVILESSSIALELAKQNWSVQKEPEDARILMKSALAVGDIEQIQLIKLMIKETGLIDARINLTSLRDSLI